MKRVGARALCALLAVWSGAARADDAFFRRCEVLRRAALVAADAGALARLMADGAQYGHSNGETDDEASLIRRLGSGELRYRSIVADEERYACSASGCEVTGTQTLGVSANGRDLTLRNRFHVTWMRAGDACSLVSYQSSPLPTPPAP
jgi:arabinogalactan endo-1,4-beta-galactosidase